MIFGLRNIAGAGLACLAGVTIYYLGDAGRAYLAADDFQWLLGGATFAWPDLAPLGRDHFYRPVVSLWFAGVSRVCGPSPECYHLLSIAVHTLNIALVFAVAFALTSRSATAFLSALLFAAQPTYVQAVVWVSAVTGLISAAFSLVALLLQIWSWRSERHASALRLAAVLTFALAVYSHEGAAVLPLIAWCLERWFGPAHRRQTRLLAGWLVVLAAFAVTTIAANRENYVFTQGHYAAGGHVLRHALDYLVSYWVGPHNVAAYLLTAIGVVVLLALGRVARFGAIWMLVGLIPYVGFTWGNVSRYAYLPAVGFSLALASILAGTTRREDSRERTGRADIVRAAIAIALVVRFAAFAVKGVEGEVTRLESSRTYVNRVLALHPRPAGETLRVPAPDPSFLEARYVEVMLRWVYQQPHLRILLE